MRGLLLIAGALVAVALVVELAIALAAVVVAGLARLAS